MSDEESRLGRRSERALSALYLQMAMSTQVAEQLQTRREQRLINQADQQGRRGAALLERKLAAQRVQSSQVSSAAQQFSRHLEEVAARYRKPPTPPSDPR